MKNTLLFICIAVACYSCSPTSLMTLSVQKPAPVTLPAYIKSVGVVNRSKATNENRMIDAIHKAFNLESAALQADGARASVDGLTDELMKSKRFTEVRDLKGLDLRSYGTGIFPSALPWDSVEKICRENNEDAIFSLELFDTESKVDYSAGPGAINTGIATIPAIAHQVNMVTLVKTGWRIYDPGSRNILDEYILSKDISGSGSSVNPLLAASALTGRSEAVKQVGNRAGQAYAYRIVPYWIRVSRYYYTGGNDQFKTAMRMAQTGNWDGAAKIWQEQTANADGKLAGRACYNMAIISEINGDLDGAIQWTQKAYENYRNRLALDYVGILRNRKANNEILKSQQALSSAQ